jgi:pyruvate dehydrogenase E1 component alpha subunit
MPEQTIESLSIKRLEILSEAGDADAALMPPLSEEQIKELYELLFVTRTFDGRALNLQREGRLGTYAPVLGQEASQVGSAYAFEKTDWLFPSFREMAVFMTIGYPMNMIFQYWSGDERGLRIPDDLNIFPISIPVGTHILHAVGAAVAMKYKGDKKAAGVYFGDGGTSEGDFHEGMNFAGTFKAPVVFICQNNHWAISVPRERQTAARSLAQKAVAYGFEGIQVDGNDVFAVYKATRDAIDKAKRGEGPTLIECVTYRMADHTTADDASRYRTKEVIEAWKPKDPIVRVKLFMEKKGIWTEAYQKELEEKSKARVDEWVRMEESVERPSPKDMFMFTYEKPTPRQLKEMGDF